MKVQVTAMRSTGSRVREGELYLDDDGDLNVVVAAANLEGVNDEDLVLVCIKDDAAWIRGPASRFDTCGMTRLVSGDAVTITVE